MFAHPVMMAVIVAALVIFIIYVMIGYKNNLRSMASWQLGISKDFPNDKVPESRKNPLSEPLERYARQAADINYDFRHTRNSLVPDMEKKLREIGLEIRDFQKQVDVAWRMDYLLEQKGESAQERVHYRRNLLKAWHKIGGWDMFK